MNGSLSDVLRHYIYILCGDHCRQEDTFWSTQRLKPLTRGLRQRLKLSFRVLSIFDEHEFRAPTTNEGHKQQGGKNIYISLKSCYTTRFYNTMMPDDVFFRTTLFSVPFELFLYLSYLFSVLCGWVSVIFFPWFYLTAKQIPLEEENKVHIMMLVLFYLQYSSFLIPSNQSINKNWCAYVLLHSFVQRLKNGKLLHIMEPIFSRY